MGASPVGRCSLWDIKKRHSMIVDGCSVVHMNLLGKVAWGQHAAQVWQYLLVEPAGIGNRGWRSHCEC